MPWKPRTFLALLVASMGCWLERQTAAQIECMKSENRLLRARLGRRRLLFTDQERRTLAALAKEIGSKVLRDFDALVSPAHCCVGIGSWSRRNGRFWNAALPAGHAQKSTLGSLSYEWPARIPAGATPAFTVPC